MDATTNGHARTDEPNPWEVPRGWKHTVPRVLGVAAFVAMAVFWAWAFANRDSIDHPDDFDDPVYAAQAESICADRQEAIAALPDPTTVDNAVERSVVLEQATVELAAMVDDLDGVPLPDDEQGSIGVQRWLDDYQLYLNDRRVYAEVLATGDDPPFLISGNADGVRVTDLLRTFAEVNDMPSCAPSGDV